VTSPKKSPASDNQQSGTGSSSIPIAGVSLSAIIVIVTILSVPLAAGQSMGLSSSLTATWIAGLYGIPSVIGIGLALRYRQPLAATSTILAIILVATVGDQFTFSELSGAFMLAGILVVILGTTGVTRRLAVWIPPPIVFGILAGAVLSFVVAIFEPLQEHTIIGVTVLVTYLLARRFLNAQPIAILPALVAGVIAAWLTGEIVYEPATVEIPVPVITVPSFSIPAIASIMPVIVILMTLQANIPSAVILRKHDYNPPDRVIDIVSGLGTFFASFLGPIAVSLSMPLTSLIAGPDAGEHNKRHRTIYITHGVALLIAFLAGAAAIIAELVPAPLLMALAGLAMLGVFIHALQETIKGPLVLGPVFAFAISVSGLSLFSFGAYFWALVVGIGVSLLLEGRAMSAMRR
jgi:benzoate membrane transport protein